METGVLNEIPPLAEGDFMYVADRRKKEFTFPIHCHDVFELNFVENAKGCQRIVGDNREVIGDFDLVLITSRNLEHVWEQHECQNDDIHEITVQFYLDFENDKSIFHTNPFKSFLQLFKRAQKGLAFPLKTIMMVYPHLLRLSTIKEGYPAVQELWNILYELSKCTDARELASSAFAKVDISSESRRVLKVKQYLEQHYKDEVRLEVLADIVGMTPTAFSRFFRQRTSQSLSEYMVNVRLGHAARKLIDSTDTISEICYCCGFNTLSNFNRLFKKNKGCTPTEFREKYKKTNVII